MGKQIAGSFFRQKFENIHIQGDTSLSEGFLLDVVSLFLQDSSDMHD